MGADTGDPSLIQNDDLLCMENRADTLGHNDRGRVRSLLFSGLSKGRISLIVQSREAVIKNVNLRLSGDGAGNGETLLLAT